MTPFSLIFFTTIKRMSRLQTSAPGVWAIGEVAGSPQFTHISADDFRVVRSNLTGGNRVTTGRQVPYCLFTDPEFAHVGFNEEEAKARNIAYRFVQSSKQGGLPFSATAASPHFRLTDSRRMSHGDSAWVRIPCLQRARLERGNRKSW
jgi:Pyridine nucleotide-disulphide oxidoreductase, dimerisation domain